MNLNRVKMNFLEIKLILLTFSCLSCANVIPEFREEYLDPDKIYASAEKEVLEYEFIPRFDDNQEKSTNVSTNISKLERFQDDIVLSKKQKEALKNPVGTRTGLLDEDYRWPKNDDGYVIVPFAISSDFCKSKQVQRSAKNLK